MSRPTPRRLAPTQAEVALAFPAPLRASNVRCMILRRQLVDPISPVHLVIEDHQPRLTPAMRATWKPCGVTLPEGRSRLRGVLR